MITLKSQLKLTLAAIFMLLAFLLVRCEAEEAESAASFSAVEEMAVDVVDFNLTISTSY